MKYLVIIERGEHNFSAYAPDVPGCIATGVTIDETLQRMKEALEFHLKGFPEEGEPLPLPLSIHAYVELNISV